MRFALHSSLLILLFVAVSALARAQETAGSGLPFNPDSDNSGVVDVTDLLNFLPYYSEEFVPTESSRLSLAVPERALSGCPGGTWFVRPRRLHHWCGELCLGSHFSPGATGVFSRVWHNSNRPLRACLRNQHECKRSIQPCAKSPDYSERHLFKC